MKRYVRMHAGVALAGALVTTSAFAAPAADPATPEADPGIAALAWGQCEGLDASKVRKLQCATLEVPLDHGHRGGETITIALSRVPAEQQSERTLLVNPGGPGSPGRQWAAATAAALPDGLAARYDVVGFDPRGTGASEPGVSCDPGFFEPVRPDTVPSSPRDEHVLLERARSYAEHCAQQVGELLGHMSTADTAHDMDLIRAALGEKRIDYLGYSYGTYLGGVYATLYPEHVGRLVLDSVLHPGREWYENNMAQSVSLDRAAGRFFDWTARHDPAYGLGSSAEDVEKRYYAIRQELAGEPAGGVVGPTEFDSAYILAAYSSRYWPRLAGALSDQVTQGDDASLVAVFERFGESPDGEPAYAAYLATECGDARWPRDYTVWRGDARRIHETAPFQAWGNTWYNAPCMFWPFEGGPWTEVDGSGVAGALLVQAEKDGPTPVAGAYAMRERFPGSRLIIEEGGTDHGVSLLGNKCVDERVAAYLRSGELPPRGGGEHAADLTCPADPEPEPRQPQQASGTGGSNLPLQR